MSRFNIENDNEFIERFMKFFNSDQVQNDFDYVHGGTAKMELSTVQEYLSDNYGKTWLEDNFLTPLVEYYDSIISQLELQNEIDTDVNDKKNEAKTLIEYLKKL